MKKAQPKIDKSFGFKSINGLYEQINKALKTIADKENVLENASVVISDDLTYSSIEEMELLINAERLQYKRMKTSIAVFKWVTILVESIGSYMVIGLFMHPINLKGMLDENFYFIIYIIQWAVSFAIAFAIANSATNYVKLKSNDHRGYNQRLGLAFLHFLILPIITILFVVIYDSILGFKIDNKEIYFITLFFTLFTGFIIVLRSSNLSEKEEKRQEMLKNYQKEFEERKELYDKVRKLYLQIFAQNNEYAGFIENFDSIDDSSTLYAPLKEFFKESSEKGFDVWCEDYIELQKSKLRLSQKKETKH